MKPMQDDLLNKGQSIGQSDYEYPDGRDHILYSYTLPIS